MKDETLRALNTINRVFYRDSAPSFDATRDAPWPGWQPLLPLLQGLEGDPARILDLGCGNGRFPIF
jgi:SAM-dependent methyltransferase